MAHGAIPAFLTATVWLSPPQKLAWWASALDLWDKATEGHTQCVAEMTLRLARRADMREAELVHVRRGALLHDIGKMGILDAILLKPAILTEEEWVIMRKHPAYAHDFLWPSAYLTAPITKAGPPRWPARPFRRAVAHNLTRR